MESPKAALAPRIAAMLREKQFLVFFAIALFALDAGAALLTAWLRRHHGLPALLRDETEPLYDLYVTGSLTIGAVAVAAIVLAGWLRVIYIRALLGREAPAAPGAFAVWSMVALIFATNGVADGVALAAAHSGTAAQLAVLLFPAIMLATLYADYAIVISDVGPLASLRRSWDTVRAATALSLAIVLALTVVDNALAFMLGRVHGGTVSAAALLVVQVFAAGSLHFVADVALITAYLDVRRPASERRQEPGGSRRLPPGS